MADFGAAAGGIVTGMLGSVVWVGVALLVILTVSFLIWWFMIYSKKFNIMVKIISERADGFNSIFFDKAGILVDRKSGASYLKLWSLKKAMKLPKFNILQNIGKQDYLEIYRDSENGLFFLTPPKINRKHIIKTDGKMYPFADQELIRVDTDMEFWSTKRKDMNKAMFDKESLIMKILPYIPHIVGGMFIIFIIYILVDHLPAIISMLKELVDSMNQMQRAQQAEVVTGLMPLLMLKWKRK